MTQPKKYTKKPVTIEATQWDGTASNATDIINWAMSHDVLIHYKCLVDHIADLCPGTEEAHALSIPTLEGDMDAAAGWWIIRGIKGEFYPCRPDVFADSYDNEKTLVLADGDEAPNLALYADGKIALRGQLK